MRVAATPRPTNPSGHPARATPGRYPAVSVEDDGLGADLGAQRATERQWWTTAEHCAADPYQSLTTSSRRGLDSPRKLSIFLAVSLRRSVGDGPSPATFFTLAFDLYRASHNLYRACLACWPHASPYLAAWWSLSLDSSARPLSIISCWVQFCASSQALQCLEVLYQLRSSFRR